MSHLPGLANYNVDGCRAANNEMAAAIKNHPTRFTGFAALPMAYPKEAAIELERAMSELGFVGAMIDDHLEDMTHYDGERFFCVFQTAERLGVPIYIYPAPCNETTLEARFLGNFRREVGFGLSRGGWGWHETVALHILKLWGANLFERLPGLKIIIGHNGELLPMWIDRLKDATFARAAGLQDFEHIWNTNIWVTTSGFFATRTFEALLKTTSIDRVMFSIDSPFVRSEVGWRFIQEIADKRLLSDKDLEKFAWANAAGLLNLKM